MDTTEGHGLKPARLDTRNGGYAPVVVFIVLGLSSLSSIADPAPVRQKELVHLVRQDCGACHGLTLQGGLGPALTSTALRDKDAQMLSSTILHGRPGTPMPPFFGILDEAETRWIADRLLTGFPPESR